MSYLARGLPRDGPPRYALASDPLDEKWRLLGIHPVEYRNEDDQHAPVHELLQRWAGDARRGLLVSHRTGHTTGGTPIDDKMIENLAEEAEREYEPGQLQGHRRGAGRPPLGSAAKIVESVRLEPSLRNAGGTPSGG